MDEKNGNEKRFEKENVISMTLKDPTFDLFIDIIVEKKNILFSFSL